MTDTEKVDISKLDTWPKVLQYNNQRIGENCKAMRYKHYGIWQSFSWRDYYENVKYLALGLLALGFKAGEKLLIIGDNAPEWYFGELAAQSNKGISVGLYSDLSTAEIKYVALNCEAEYAIVEDQEQADKIEQIIAQLPKLRKVVYWRYKGLSKQKSELFSGFRDVLKLGREYEKNHPQTFEKNVAEGKAEDICAIIYTSGTTGERPKGALHTYKSLKWTSEYYMNLDRIGQKDNLVSYLPPAWITEQSLVFGCHLLSGSTVNFAESAETLQEDIREIGPTVVLYSSRLWERQAGKVQARIQGSGGLKKMAFRWFMPAGYKLAESRSKKQNPGWPLRVLDFLGYWLLFRPLRDNLGLPHARICYSSGATLCADVFRFYHALNVPLKNLYGSTEAGAITEIVDNGIRLKESGAVNKGLEVKITLDGEIITRSPGAFSGYYNNLELTAGVLKDGWVYTGDCGYLTEDNQLVFIDRLTDLLRLPCGDIISSQDIESRLKYSPYIRDAWVLAGQDCEYTSAVIVIDAENTSRWADKHKVVYTTFGDLSQKPEVIQLIKLEIERINEQLPNGGKIKKFVNLNKEFDPDEGEMTRTRKLKKAFLRKRYSDLIAALSGNKTNVEVESQFTYQDGRVGKTKTSLIIKTVEESKA
jgi:long-chain acyl-CoA synthetase